MNHYIAAQLTTNESSILLLLVLHLLLLQLALMNSVENGGIDELGDGSWPLRQLRLHGNVAIWNGFGASFVLGLGR